MLSFNFFPLGLIVKRLFISDPYRLALIGMMMTREIMDVDPVNGRKWTILTTSLIVNGSNALGYGGIHFESHHSHDLTSAGFPI